jgi:tripartite-type tricarboxylate transporter receptor subunit TctC
LLRHHRFDLRLFRNTPEDRAAQQASQAMRTQSAIEGMMFKAGLLAVAAIVIAVPSAGAQPSVANFYKGKNINVYIGFSVGGVYDINARLLSRYMAKYIPGNPTLVPRQMTGAGSFTLASWLYQAAPKDGATIGTFARGIAFNPLIGEPTGAIEAAKFNWIGSTNDEVSVCVSRRESGVSKLEQVFERELVVGSGGASADDDQFPRLMNSVLGTKFRIVRGFPGGNEIKLAMLRGEVGGRCGWSWSSVKATEAEWLREGSISMLAQLSLRRHPDLPDTPLISDFAKTDEARQIFKVALARQVMAWPFAAPPDTPVERVAALRKAFDDTLRDQDYLAEAKKLNLEITPVPGERIQSLIADVYRTTSAELSAKIAAMLK